MATSMLNTIRCCSGILFQNGSNSLCTRMLSAPMINFTPVMHHSRKHWNPKFRRLRREKTLFIKKETPDFDKLTSHERRMKLKKLGMPYGVDLKTREINISSTDQLFNDYVPREEEGKKNQIKRLLKDKSQFVAEPLKGKVTMIRARGKIRKYDNPDFKYDEIAPQLQNIYIESQKLLADVKKNQELLFDYVTLNAFKKMTNNVEHTTVVWEFVESMEPPRVVNASAIELGIDDNMFAQITLRIHIRQKLAIYDRFGRLMYGDPDLVKNVLEFIVFESHITSIHSRWRVHDKIIPKWWDREKVSVLRSYIENNYEEDEDEVK